MTMRFSSQVGIKDWTQQRLSAVFLLIYLVLMAVLLIKHAPFDLITWKDLFHPLWFKIFSILAFMSIVIHAWVGMWTIFTDYVHPWSLRFLLMSLVALALLGYFIWFVQILWGV